MNNIFSWVPAGIGLLLALTLAGCSVDNTEPGQRKPQQAGQAMDPAVVAARLAAIRAEAMVGDKKAVKSNMQAMQDDFRKSIKLADPSHRIDPESARSAAKSVAGVRSVVWLDRDNLFAIVERNELRSYETIDNICLALEPLGDTLGVVVNLQSGEAKNGDNLEVMSRNCQLAPGERALLQRNRMVDVVDPAIRAQHKRDEAQSAGRKSDATDAENMKILERTTPEIKR